MAAASRLSAPRRSFLTAVFSAAAIFVASTSAFGAATPPPGPSGANARWNNSSSLKPHPSLPILEDYTWWAGSEPQNGNVKQFFALDIENGMLFAATGQGIEVINVRSGPNSEEDIYLFGYDFPAWSYRGDADWFVYYLDAPAGNSNVVALSMEQQGFAVLRSANALDWTSPVVAYHASADGSAAVHTTRVYSVRAAGTDWAYALNTNAKLVRFNLSATSSMNRCVDTIPGVTCAGVYKGEVTSVGSGWTALHGVGNFLATGKWQGGGAIKLWGLSDPAAPNELMNLAAPAMGVAMWQAGGSTYLARIDQTKTLSIHDVSCISSGACSSAPVLSNQTLASPSSLTQVTVSQDAGKTYLYVGGEDQGSCAPQREYVFDVTNPANPTELTPQIHPDGYWGWYYQHCPTGFNLVGPRMGQVYNSVLYRAAATLLDAHQLAQAGPPTASFSWSPTSGIYPGTPVQFSDQSSGLPTSWSWSFEDGTPATATVASPSVTFATAGTKNVTLDVSNQYGLGTPSSRSVTVLDPSPHADSITVTPAAPIVCQPVTLTAVNSGGQPTLAYQWVVEDVSGPVFSQTNGNTSQVWNTGPQGSNPAASPGNYTAKVTISNNAGSVTKTAAFTLAATPALPGNGQFTPTTDPFTAGTVKFHVVAAGATEWNWDFDGDSVFNESDWTSDPVNGPNPTHVYATTGVRQVTVKVRNCVDGVGTQSAAVEVNITQITPLNALFVLSGGASCLPGIPACSANAGSPVTFRDLSTGAELWDFDWNGDGTFEQAGLDAADFEASELGPTISHVYAAAGTFTPVLRVRRGSEVDTYELDKAIVVGSATPAGINVNGPNSGLTGNALTFTASPTGSCSPAASGWSWQLAGGSASGSTSGSSVTVTWSSTGSKGITATNSACPGASGSMTVTITSPTQGSTLQAIFSYSPAAPQSGQPVTFNGSSSTGAPTDYTWSFGDGTANGTGAQATHTYGSAGTYSVQLTVAKLSSACPPLPFCQSTLSKVVTVTGGSVPQADFTYIPAAPKAAEVVTFNGGISSNVPAGSTFSWEFGDGATSTSQVALHAFAAAGTFQVRFSIAPPGCTSLTCVATKTKAVVVAPGGGPQFTVSPAVLGAGEEIAFDSSPSTNVNPASGFTWDFGDGTPPKIGRLVSHVFAQPGTYNVVLTVAAPGCQAVSCLGVVAKQVTVGPAPAVTGNFTSDAVCENLTCQAQTGRAVRLTANATDATSYNWSFGDGTTGTGRQVWHAWAEAGSYPVSLSVSKGTASGSHSRTFAVTGVAPVKKPMQLLPLAVTGNTPLLQSSDVYVHNPGDVGMGVVLELRRQSQPEADPPRVHASLAPRSTVMIADVLRTVFGFENAAGYIAVSAESGDVDPVATILGNSGRQAKALFGLGVNGATVANGGLAYLSPSHSPPQHLVGMGDTSERQSSLVLSNPSDQPATYKLRFFDKLGNELGTSTDLQLDRFAQRRFPVEELRASFGIAGVADYRVEIESISGPPVFPFAADVRTTSGDLSSITPGTYAHNRLYLLGVSSGKLAGKTWQTDLVIANVGDQSAQATYTYAKASGKGATKAAAPVSLAAGASQRIDNALANQLGVSAGGGVMTITLSTTGDVYPVVTADNFDNTNPQKRSGQRIPALSDADAAAAGEKVTVAGLRQGAGNVATLWIFNPSGGPGLYDVTYRALDGKVLSTRNGISVAAGQVRQLSGAEHGIKKNRGASGFTVEITVRNGSALAAAQVTRKGSTDPAYVVGVRR